MIFERRDERMKALAKALSSASHKAEKAISEAQQKSVAADRAMSGADKRRLESEAQAAWGKALAALDECKGLSICAIDAYKNT